MKESLRAVISLSFVAALTACGAASPEMESFRIADSAAIEVVESLEPAWRPGEEWRLTASPMVEIGEEDGDPNYLFSQVVGAVRLDDARIVVGDRGGNQLRFYDRRGEYLDAVGGSGQGPGEFEYLRALFRCGTDSIFGFDLHWQAKVFDLEGRYARQLRLTEPGSPRTPYNVSCSRTGHFLITGWGDHVQDATRSIWFYRTTSPVSVLDRDGAPILDLGEFPSSERIGHPYGSRPHPFGKTTVLALGPERIYVGTGDALVRPEERPAVERELAEMPMPTSFPAYSGLQLDADGNLWVQRYLRPGDREPIWAVFSTKGVLLGEVTVPARLRITEIGSDYLLGVHSDDLGVQRVRVYGLVKGRLVL